MAPRWLQMAPKSPRRLQDRPKIGPKMAQNRPKMAQDGPKMCQNRPRLAQDGLLGPSKAVLEGLGLPKAWKKKWFGVRFDFDLLSTQACSTYSRRAVSLWRPSTINEDSDVQSSKSEVNFEYIEKNNGLKEQKRFIKNL